MRIIFRTILMLSLLAMTLAGCGGKTMVESDLRIKGAPDWVNEGTNVLNDRGGRLFHGVGSSKPLGDDSLQQSTADSRARAELARILTSYMDVVSKDYIGAAQSGGQQASEESVSRQISALSQVNITGSKIIARWKDKRTNIIYALAELDLKQVKDTTETISEMNQGLKEHIKTQGDNIFDRIAGGK